MRAAEGFSIGNTRFSLLSLIGMHVLVCSHTCCKQSAHDRSQRSGVLSARCNKRLFSRQGLVYFSEFFAGRISHTHTLPQFMHRLTLVPRSLRSLLVSLCKRCSQYVVYDSLFQHSCVHTHHKYDVIFLFFVLLFLVFRCTNNTAWIRSVYHSVAIDTGWYTIYSSLPGETAMFRIIST